MGSSVSQIPFWLDTTVNKSDNDNTFDGDNKAIYLSYNVFLGLSVLGGFFGLDHLYLRSPLTFIAKFIANIFTFGTWWLYDATQAIFNKDVVKIFGLGVPGLGPKGIAAGVLARDIPDKKHMAFFIYALALFGGGIFGLDSFIVGNKFYGFIRLMCLITIIFAPIAIFIWLYRVAIFLFKTNDVIKQHSEYFGAPYDGFSYKSMFSFLDIFLDPLIAIKDALLGTASTAVCATKSVVDTASTAVDNVVSETKAVAKTVGELGTTVGKFQFNPPIAQRALGQMVQPQMVQPQMVQPQMVQPQMVQPQMVQPQMVQSYIGQRGGGIINNDNTVLPYMVIATFGLITVSGLILTYRRFRQNGKQHKTDDPPIPPESGVLRESDKKESPKAT
jgi:hypothetical protein